MTETYVVHGLERWPWAVHWTIDNNTPLWPSGHTQRRLKNIQLFSLETGRRRVLSRYCKNESQRPQGPPSLGTGIALVSALRARVPSFSMVALLNKLPTGFPLQLHTTTLDSCPCDYCFTYLHIWTISIPIMDGVISTSARECVVR